MTRKRFVKLLMAAGYDRIEANDVATDARRRGVEYSTACIVARAVKTVRTKWDAVNIDAVCDAIRNIADMAVKVVHALENAAAAFAKAFRENMEASHE